MNTYQNVDMMWMDAYDLVVKAGNPVDSRDGKTKEVLGYQAALTNVEQTFLLNPIRRLNPMYASAEFLWYLSGARDITMIKGYAPQYERFSEKGIAFGAYGWRLRQHSQLLKTIQVYAKQLEGLAVNGQVSSLITLLQRKPDSRQAILTMWDASDLVHAIMGDKKDLPCTLSIQFFIRDGWLNCIATMRSNDIWLGLPYDVFCFTCLQRLIAEALKIPTGFYIHQAGSLHLYARNAEKMDTAANKPSIVEAEHLWAPHESPISQATHDAIEFESDWRHGGEGDVS